MRTTQRNIVIRWVNAATQRSRQFQHEMRKAMTPNFDADHMAFLGSLSSRKKAEAARENGRRGGRPPKWSQQARSLAAQWIRTNVEAGCVPNRGSSLEWELIKLARALEEATLR
jgi:hypothetical protein